MEKKVLSFRVSEAEISAIEALQQPEDSSLGQTALRLLRSLIGVQPDTTVNAVDTYEIKDRVESLEERLNGAVITREQLSDFVNDIVDERIRIALDTLSDHENRLINIEQAQEVRSHSPVTTEVTTQDVVSSLLQDKEDANRIQSNRGRDSFSPGRKEIISSTT
jgi:regulator of replication initiation timing